MGKKQTKLIDHPVPILLILLVIIILFGVKPSFSEHIFLKDGKIIIGTIVRDGAGSITIRKKDRKIQQYKRKNIMRILYMRVYMGKIFVRMTDGRTLQVYKVDEDQETYTLRKNLYVPKEFKVLRKQVMFIARSNPTDLKAKAGQTEISMTWSPPYLPPHHYKIYLKEGQDAYRVADSTGDTEHTLEDLKSNTKYRVKITAVDSEDNESLPTDDVSLITKNIPPEQPGSIAIKNEVSRDNISEVRLFTWEKSSDPDGTVKEYRIYKKSDNGYSQIGRTANLSFTIPDGISENDLAVRAVDNLGTESERGGFLPLWLQLDIYPVFILPFGTFGDLFSYGIGGLVQVMFTDIVFDNFILGIKTGGVYFLHNDESVNYMLMVPLTFNIGYTFQFFRDFFVTPTISAGYVYMNAKYSSRGASSKEPLSDRTENLYEPIVEGGINIQYLITRRIAIGGGANFGFIYEETELMKFLTFTIGVGFNF